jgi:hypothetical protein
MGSGRRRRIFPTEALESGGGPIGGVLWWGWLNPSRSPIPGHLVLAATLAEQKALDREIPYSRIPPEHVHEYHRAEEKE